MFLGNIGWSATEKYVSFKTGLWLPSSANITRTTSIDNYFQCLTGKYISLRSQGQSKEAATGIDFISKFCHQRKDVQNREDLGRRCKVPTISSS